MRPYGVSFIFAGWDNKLGFQLYHSDPSGNYAGWEAAAIGANCQTAQSILKTQYQSDLAIEDAKKLVLLVLKKIMDVTELSSDSVEVLELTIDSDALVSKRLTSDEIMELSEPIT